MSVRLSAFVLVSCCALTALGCGAPPVEEAQQAVAEAVSSNPLAVQSNPWVGAWSIVSIAPPGASQSPTAEPGLVIYTPDGYYSHATFMGAEPRVPFAVPGAATDEEKITRFDSLAFNAGRYEVSGTTLTYRPLFGLRGGSGGHMTWEFSFDGDVLTLTVSEIAAPDGTDVTGQFAGFVETLQRLP